MTRDNELLAFTAVAAIAFAAIALFFGSYLRRSRRFQRLKPPPPALVVIFRLWFAALSLGAFYLTLFGREGLFPTH